MLLARAVTGRREIVRNAWNIYRNPKLIKTSHHSSRGSLSPASKTRDWISFKIFTYDAPADQWSCTQRDNELAADLMLRVQTQESQALWSPITNGEIIFMIPAARGICIQIYIHIFTSFVYMNAFLLEGNHHTHTRHHATIIGTFDQKRYQKWRVQWRKWKNETNLLSKFIFEYE